MTQVLKTGSFNTGPAAVMRVAGLHCTCHKSWVLVPTGHPYDCFSNMDLSGFCGKSLVAESNLTHRVVPPHEQPPILYQHTYIHTLYICPSFLAEKLIISSLFRPVKAAEVLHPAESILIGAQSQKGRSRWKYVDLSQWPKPSCPSWLLPALYTLPWTKNTSILILRTAVFMETSLTCNYIFVYRLTCANNCVVSPTSCKLHLLRLQGWKGNTVIIVSKMA